MSQAFEVTPDDVGIVLCRRMKINVDNDGPLVGRLMDLLDMDSIESSALYENELDDQTTAAHDDIFNQFNSDEDCKALIEAHRALAGINLKNKASP